MSELEKNITQGVPVKEVCILAAYNKKAIAGTDSGLNTDSSTEEEWVILKE